MTEEEIKARLMDLCIQLNNLIREAYGSQIVANVETITKESGKDILYAVIKPTSGNDDKIILSSYIGGLKYDSES